MLYAVNDIALMAFVIRQERGVTDACRVFYNLLKKDLL